MMTCIKEEVILFEFGWLCRAMGRKRR